jgi:putative redox protein
MKSDIKHLSNLAFSATVRDHQFFMDAQASAGGDNKGPSPKELLLSGIIGCAGMDVVSILKKHKMVADELLISAEANPRKEHPKIFEKVDIQFKARGNVGKNELNEAVKLSLTKYCGVTAMITKTVPVHYKVLLNDVEIDSGIAKFD